jgi:hypothetical protein
LAGRAYYYDEPVFAAPFISIATINAWTASSYNQTANGLWPGQMVIVAHFFLFSD